MNYFCVSNSEGLKAATTYYESDKMGKLIDGMGTVRTHGDEFPALYYVSGIEPFDNLLEGIKMWERKVSLEIHLYERYDLCLILSGSKGSSIVSVPKANIQSIALSKTTEGFQRKKSITTALLSSGSFGLLGMFGGKLKQKAEQVTSEKTFGGNLTISLNSGELLEFFCPLDDVMSVIKFFKKHLPERCDFK